MPTPHGTDTPPTGVRQAYPDPTTHPDAPFYVLVADPYVVDGAYVVDDACAVWARRRTEQGADMLIATFPPGASAVVPQSTADVVTHGFRRYRIAELLVDQLDAANRPPPTPLVRAMRSRRALWDAMNEADMAVEALVDHLTRDERPDAADGG